MKTAVTKRTDTIKNPHNKQEMEKTSKEKTSRKTRRVGGRKIRQWRTVTRKVGNLISHVTSTPRTLAPRPPDVCEKKRFPLFSCLSQRKTTLFSEPSTSLRLWVTHVKNVKKLGGHLIRFGDTMFKRSPKI